MMVSYCDILNCKSPSKNRRWASEYFSVGRLDLFGAVGTGRLGCALSNYCGAGTTWPCNSPCVIGDCPIMWTHGMDGYPRYYAFYCRGRCGIINWVYLLGHPGQIHRRRSTSQPLRVQTKTPALGKRNLMN